MGEFVKMYEFAHKVLYMEIILRGTSRAPSPTSKTAVSQKSGCFETASCSVCNAAFTR